MGINSNVVKHGIKILAPLSGGSQRIVTHRNL